MSMGKRMILRPLAPLVALAACFDSNASAQEAAAFQKACAGCHPAPAALARKIKGASEEERKSHLAALLKSHHPPEPAAVDKVISYILTLPAK